MEPKLGIEGKFGTKAQTREAKFTGVSGEYAGASIIFNKNNRTVELGTSSCLANLVFWKKVKAIAPRHATLVFDEEKGLLICDQNSQFGTFVNEARLPEGFSVRLNHGDTIEIGDRNNMFRVSIA